MQLKHGCCLMAMHNFDLLADKDLSYNVHVNPPEVWQAGVAVHVGQRQVVDFKAIR